jgi:alkylglycerol monooxygenase
MDTLLIVIAIPVFFLFIGVEQLIAWRKRKKVYRFADAVSNLGNGIGMQVLGAFFIPVSVGAYDWLFRHARVHTISEKSIIGWIVLFFGVDLGYYVFHRASHRVNFLWAMHVVHHQSEEYNYSVALRQSWFDQLISWVFYIPLAIAGFPTLMFLTMSTLNTLYQFFIHTRLVGKMGPLETVMNTPSHHRVHHGVNPRYIDRNYGGILVIWDRIFGSFEPEGEEPVYGIVKPLGRYNVLVANFHYYVEMAKLSAASTTIGERIFAWLAPPEWRPRALGGNVTVPAPARSGPSFEAPAANGDWIIAAQFVLVVIATSWFIYASGTQGTTRVAVDAVAFGILALVIGFGIAHDRRLSRASTAIAKAA